jgi:hypothetical protein
LDALRVDFFSPPWLLLLLEALAWLRDDLASLLAELRSDLLRELLFELLDCFVAMWNSLNALRWGSPFLATGVDVTVPEQAGVRTRRRS